MEDNLNQADGLTTRLKAVETAWRSVDDWAKLGYIKAAETDIEKVISELRKLQAHLKTYREEPPQKLGCGHDGLLSMFPDSKGLSQCTQCANDAGAYLKGDI